MMSTAIYGKNSSTTGNCQFGPLIHRVQPLRTATSTGGSESKLFMSSVTATPAQGSQAQRQRRRRRAGKFFALIVILVCAAVGATVFALSRAWPFSQVRVLQNLREASDSQVQIRDFRQTYLPAPGCILEEVSFRHGSAETKPLITLVRLTIRGSYLGLPFAASQPHYRRRHANIYSALRHWRSVPYHAVKNYD
jgi:hypothetical protein